MFEQNPLSAVAERLVQRSLEGMADSERVREAIREVLESGGHFDEVARRWHVAPSALADWHRRYVAFLEQDVAVAEKVLVSEAGMVRDADLVTVPEAARELFQANWDRLVQATRLSEESFRQHPWRVFLETSWVTGWLYNEGKLDRNALAGSLVAVVSLLVVGGFLLSGRYLRPDPPPEAAPVSLSDEEVIEKAAEVAQAFFRAADTDGKLQWVRGGTEARALAEAYFAAHPPQPINDAILTLGMTTRGITSLEFDVPSQERRQLINVVERGGRMLVDWETSSLFQEANLKRLRETRPAASVRVAVKISQGPDDNYYNYGFTEDQWVCYRLTYPGLVLDLYGYARRDTKEHIELEALLSARELMDGGRSEAVILEVRYPEAARAANQVEIVRMLKDKWVTE